MNRESGRRLTMFKSWHQKTVMYNRIFNTIEQQKDPELRARMGKAFDEIRRVNREFEKLVAEATGEQLQ